MQGFYEVFPRDLRRNGLRRLLPDFCSVSKRVFTMCLQGFPHASLRGVHDALTRCLRKVLTRFLRHVHKALVAFSQGAQSVFTKHIQRVYKTFIMFLEGVRWLPTISGVRTSQIEFMEWKRVRRINMEEGAYQNSTPRQRFSRRKPPSQKLLFIAWVLMHVAAVVCFLPCLSVHRRFRCLVLLCVCWHLGATKIDEVTLMRPIHGNL